MLFRSKTSHIFHCIDGFGGFLADSYEFPHRLRPSIPVIEITFTKGLPHEFRNSGLPASGKRVNSAPEGIVKVQLDTPQDVYYKSPRIQARIIGVARVLIRLGENHSLTVVALKAIPDST